MIEFSVCLLLTVIFCILAFVQSRPNTNVLLGVTLPLDHIEAPPVLAVLRKYRRNMLLFACAALAAALPLLLLPAYISMQFGYMAVWIAGAILAYSKISTARMRELYAIKQKNEWFVGGVHTIHIDTAVSREKEHMPISAYWLLPSFLMAAAGILYPLLSKNASLPAWAPLMLFIFPLLGLVLHRVYLTYPTTALCESSEINLAYNRVWRRRWSICCAIIGNGGAALELVAFWVLYKKPASAALPVSLLTAATVLLVFGATLFTHQSVREAQKRLLEAADHPILVDDDVYWQSGAYNNPDDPRLMVEKRFEAGMTLNLGNPGGRLLALCGGVLIGGLMIGLFLLFLAFDLATFAPVVENGEVTIKAPLYSTQFRLEEIESVTPVQSLPDGTRTNGLGGSQYSVGHFSLSGYGDCMLFVYHHTPPYLVIRLKDRTVILNGQTPEETRRYQSILQPIQASQK